LKLPIATSLLPSGVMSILDTPTRALAPPLVGVQLWLTVTVLVMNESTTPVVAPIDTIPPAVWPPIWVNVPPTNSRRRSGRRC
jgi:hypothetical protein